MAIKLLMYITSFICFGIGLYAFITKKFEFKNGMVASGNLTLIIGILAILLGGYVLYYAIKGYNGNDR